jgi:long-chain acyl-CoA synthetase
MINVEEIVTECPEPGQRTLHGLLDVALARHAPRTALLHGSDAFTFGQVDRLSDGYAGVLRLAGLGAGDRVALMGKARPHFVVAALAALKLGAAVVLVSPAYRRGEIAHAIELCRPGCLLADGELLAMAAEASGGLVLDLDDVLLAGQALPSPSPAPVAPARDWGAAEAALVFSSGTTGLPKAAVHTHASLGAAVGQWAGALGLGAQDRFQIATPPSHILGLLNILAALTRGATVRLHERFEVGEILRCIEADRLTLEMAVAPIALALAEYPSIESFDLSSLRYIMWCATPVVPAVAERVTARTGVRFITAYGASEVPLISASRVGGPPSSWRVDTAGQVIDEIEVRVVDPGTGRAAEPGRTGEIQARGPSVMTGYLPAEANAAAFSDGWYRTGDIGWVEPGGWVHITDRLREMIKVKGFQVAPAEVEAVLIGHPAVADCAVFGVPDERTGEAVVAAVVAAPGAAVDEAELQELVAASLAKYKRPARVVVRAAIPRTPSGKVLRRALRAEWAEWAGQATAAAAG